MNYITLPAKFSNGVIKPIGDIKGNPSKIMVTLEYTENEDISERSILSDRLDDYKNGENIYDLEDINSLMKKRGIIN